VTAAPVQRARPNVAVCNERLCRYTGVLTGFLRLALPAGAPEKHRQPGNAWGRASGPGEEVEAWICS
jgi:hypothetical protein